MKLSNLRVSRISFGNIVYYIAIILLTVKTVLNTSELFILNSFFDNGIFLMCIVLIVYKFVLIKFSIIRIIAGGIIGLLCLYTSFLTESYHIFISFLVIIGLYKSDKKTVIKCISYTLNITILIHIIFYIINYLYGNIDTALIMKGGKVVYTHTLYLGHSNTVGMYIIWGIFSLVYLNFSKINSRHVVMLLVFISYAYGFLQSRTFLLIGYIGVLLIFLLKYIKIVQFRLILNHLCRYGFIYLILISIIPCIFYSKFINIASIDKMFSGRLSLANFAYENYGSTIFGQSIDYFKNYGEISMWRVTRLTIDNMILRLFINYGIFYLFLYNFIINKASKRLEDCEKILVILLLFYSFSEIYTLNAIICFPLTICGWYFIND